MSLDHLPLGTRRVLVTGGGSGIGRAIAAALLARGGHVAVCGRRAAPLRELAAAAPGRVAALPCDLTEAPARADVLVRARDALGGLDGLVCAAGVAQHQPLGAIDEPALRAQLELNLVVPLRLAEDALRLLEDGGAILFVSSTLAQHPLADTAVYSATKAALVAVMQAVALAGAPRRLRATAVSPGVIDTAMIRAARTAADLEHLRAGIPLGRLGAATDVAEAALHLLAAPWTTGATLVVDGGRS